jgi:hypothetical protein
MIDDTRCQLLYIIKLKYRVVEPDDAPERIVDYGKGKFNVLCKTVDTYPLDNSVDLMAPPSALALLVVIHDTVLHLCIRVSALRVISRREPPILYLYLVI